MNPRFVTALAFALALSQVAATTAMAKEPVAPTSFRSAAPQSFTTADLQRYGLSSADASAVQAQQASGKQVVVLTPEEAAKYRAGAIPGMWWIIGGVVLVVAIVAIAND